MEICFETKATTVKTPQLQLQIQYVALDPKDFNSENTAEKIFQGSTKKAEMRTLDIEMNYLGDS